MIKSLCGVLFVLTLGSVDSLYAQDLKEDPRVTDAIRVWKEWVEYQAAVNNVPALSLGIVHDQTLLDADGFGLANPEEEKPATPETLYSICSISKLFTSIAVLQLRDEGKLRLEDSVAEHLEWFNIQDIHSGDGPITIRGLLTHSAGLPRESDYPYWTDGEYPFPTHEQVLDKLGDQQTLYPASRFFQYSNLGFTLAGEIVAAESGEDYATYVRTHLLDPLEMNDTFTEVPVQLRGGRLALGYSALNRDGSRDLVAPFQTRGIAPAAGFASNVNDLARFAMWQNRLLKNGGEEVLNASTLREMHRVHWVDPDWKTTWGLGFAVSREGERTFVSHGGGCPGYYTHFRLEPKTKMAAIVLSNAIGSKVEDYTAKAFDLIAPAIEKAQDERNPAPKRDPELDRYAGVYKSIWNQWAIVRWEDSLAALDLGSDNPKEALHDLKPAGSHRFRLVRKDDNDIPGDEFVFEVNSDGEATRFKQHSNWYEKIR